MTENILHEYICGVLFPCADGAARLLAEAGLDRPDGYASGARSGHIEP